VFDVVDALPNESTQWSDSDNDGYGDNPDGAEGDDCVLTYGTSHIDRLGCPDNDNDGYANTFDDCPDVAGASSQGVLGCPDSDGDGYADVADECPDDATKWEYGTVCIEEVNDEENKNESGDITNEEDTLVGQCTCPDGSIGMLVGPADDDGTDDGCFCGNSDAEIIAGHIYRFSLLSSHLKKLKQRKTVNIPCYDFSTHSRTKNTEQITPTELIIVDGILILSSQKLSELFDLKIYIETTDEIRFQRRLNRDVKERKRKPEGVLTQWNNQVLPMHKKFVENSATLADIILSGESNIDESVKKIVSKINNI
jgi:dephospho-CoA kinase